MFFHAIATLPGGRRKSIVNNTEDQVLTETVIPFVRTGVITARWGATIQSYQVLELRICGTEKAWLKSSGTPLDEFIGRAANRYSTFAKRAQRALTVTAHRVFVVMPIQGEQYGSQDEQRILKEYDSRFEAIEQLLGEYGAVAIRIDKEHTLDELVRRIKEEIQQCKFVIADLTDERPSCYYEAGYADALGKSTLFVSSKESVLNPKTKTKIHFDIHRNVNFFVNNVELRHKLKAAIDKNRRQLFGESETDSRQQRARLATRAGRSARMVAPNSSRKRVRGQPTNVSELNAKEAAVLRALKVTSTNLTLEQLASAAFPSKTASKANSWARNSLRRPLRLGLVAKVGRGTYKLTPAGSRFLT